LRAETPASEVPKYCPCLTLAWPETWHAHASIYV
jgi:hypothetical protein